MSAQELLPQLLGPFGLLVALLIAILAYTREWVVPGHTYRRQLRETEYWRRLALSGTSLAAKSLEVAKEQAATAARQLVRETEGL